MYAGVPINTPGSVAGAVGWAADAAPAGSKRARPKSRIFKRPSVVRITFSGLRSRCVMPFACALASAAASSRAVATIVSTDGWRAAAISSRSVWPSTNSVAMKRMSPTSSNAYTVQMPGCVKTAAARASRRRRSRCTGSRVRFGASAFNATVRPSFSSDAR